MKFDPRLPDTNDNVSTQKPLVEFSKIALGAAAILLTLIIGIGALTNLVFPHLPNSWVQSAGKLVVRRYTPVPDHDALPKIEAMIAQIQAASPIKTGPLNVIIAKHSAINAVALMGGTIVVHTGLIDAVESDAELQFVLAHEVGHFVNQDHRNAIGLPLGLTIVSIGILGAESPLNDWLLGLVEARMLAFSRKQELAADRFAQTTLSRLKWETKGGVDFLNRIEKKRKHSPLFNYFSTHPHPKARIEALQK